MGYYWEITGIMGYGISVMENISWDGGYEWDLEPLY
jgi:hypothetical protein